MSDRTLLPIEILERISDGFAAVDRNCCYVFVNRQGAELLGRSQEDLIGKGICDVLPEACGHSFCQACRKALSDQSPAVLEVYCEPRDRWFVNRIYPSADGLTIFFVEITDPKRTVRDLRKHEARLRLAVSAANVGLWDWDLITNEVVFSPEWKSQIGYSDCEIPNRFEEWQSRVHPDDIEPTLEKVRAFIANPQGRHEVEFRFRHKDGSYRWICAQGDVLRNAAGQPTHMLGCHIDITTLRLAEEKEREVGLRWAGVLEKMSDPFITWDGEWRLAYCNAAAEREMGFRREELLGRDIRPLFHPDPADPLRVLYERAMAERLPVTYEGFHQPQSRWIEVRAYPSADGGLSVFLRNVTERVQQQDALRESERCLNEAQRLARIGSWQHAPGHPPILSDQMYELFKLPRGKPITKDAALSVIHPEDRGGSYGYLFEHAVQGGLSDVHREFRVVWPDGEVRTLSSWGEIRRDPAGEMIDAIGTVQDVTERKQAEEALRRSEASYRSLFDNMLNYVCHARLIFDGDEVVDFEYLAVNRAFQARRGMPNLVGMRITQISPQITQTDPGWFELLGRVARTGVPEFRELWLEAAKDWYSVAVYRQSSDQVVFVFDVITERKDTEKALLESEEEFRTLVNFVPQMVWMCTPDGLNIYFNQRWVDYTGMSLEESYGQGWNAPFHDDDKQAAWDAWTHAVATGETYAVESRLRAADGSYRWFLMQGVPMRDAAGRIVRWFGTCTDIEEMKQAEAALREREYLLSASQRVAHIGTWSSKVGDTKPNFSDENYRIYGLSPENGPPDIESFFEIVHPEDRQRMREWHGAILAGLHPPSLEFRASLPDGSLRVIRTAGDVIETVNGVPSRIAGTAYDVTERKHTEEALRKSEAKFRAAFSALVEGIVIMDNDARVTDTNTSLEKLVGYDRESLADPSGEPRPGIIREDGSPFPVDELPARVALRTGEALRDVVMGIPKPDGSLTWVAVNSQPMRDDVGNLHGVVSSLFDITGRKRAEDEIRQLNADLENRVRERTAQLQSINRELETFTYSVSHDLKAPLRGIDGYSQLLLQSCSDQLSEEGRHFAQSIRTAAEQMTELIDDLLAYSRLERRDLAVTAVDLRRLVDQLATQCAAEVAERNVRLSITIPRFIANVDRDGMLIAIRNLLENALKFTRSTPSPEIEIGGNETQSEYTIWVKDNGPGFDMKYHDRIFEIFQRLHRAEDYPGTGVGLALVRKAMARLGGRVWAKSAPSSGAAFYLELPK